MLSFILTFFLLINSYFIVENIHSDKIFYNFISYENELYVSSNKGIYKIDNSREDILISYDQSITGPIKSDFSKNSHFKMKFLDSSFIDKRLPDNIQLTTATDFAYLGNNLFVIKKGNLLVFDLSYNFSPYESVRSITDSSIGTYNGVYVKGKKLEKVTYTDGQIKEFENNTFVCYNGLLSIENNIETILYDNDNSVRTKGEYGNIRDIFLINTSNYLVISTKGLYIYDYKNNLFKEIYSCKTNIIPIKNKINERILDREEFHFIDNNKYISFNLKNNTFNIIEDNMYHNIKDILECDINGNLFYAISESNFFLSYIRTQNGLKLLDQSPIELTAHTISDFNDIIFLSGNNGLSIFDKTKKMFFRGFIKDEFNTNAVNKSFNKISFGSIHGIYTISDVKNFYKNLVFKDYKINRKVPFIKIIIISFIVLFILTFLWFFKKKNISNAKLVFNIKSFILKNLNVVTLKMLENEFNLDYYQINSLDKNFKPAKFIKKERFDLVKKMLLNKKSIDEISVKTGYSKTYLLKNKYLFLK